MELSLYQIDAFTDKPFSGNPACVMPLEEWLPDEILLQLAKENAVAETTFFIIQQDHVALRWFTPEIEMDLCGHATLASAFVLKEFLNYDKEEILFQTDSGLLTVSSNDGLYTLDLPSRMPEETELLPNIHDSLSIKPKAVFKSRDYVLLYDNEQQIRDITVDRQLLDKINLDPGGVIVTAPGNDCDFVSRFFTPQASILEDPVTGSAHCSLIPFWSKRLNKNSMQAKQLSEREGELLCEDKGDRVLLSGRAVAYLQGTVNLH